MAEAAIIFSLAIAIIVIVIGAFMTADEYTNRAIHVSATATPTPIPTNGATATITPIPTNGATATPTPIPTPTATPTPTADLESCAYQSGQAQAVCYIDLAVAYDDESICLEFVSGTYKDSCYYQVAVQNARSSVCNSISDPLKKQDCKDHT